MSKELQTVDPASFAVATRPEVSGIVAEAFANGVRPFDLQRIKVPAGGSIAWTVPTLKGDEAMKHIDCIIAFVHAKQRAWYHQESDEDSNVPPSCYSSEGLTGVGNNTLDQDKAAIGTHDCPTCPWSKWGSARNEGGGKDCSDFAHLYLFRQGSHMPTMLKIPATSLKAMNAYTMQLADAGYRMRSVVTRLGLEPKKSAASGKPFGAVTFEFLEELNSDEYDAIKEVASVIEASVLKVPVVTATPLNESGG